MKENTSQYPVLGKRAKRRGLSSWRIGIAETVSSFQFPVSSLLRFALLFAAVCLLPTAYCFAQGTISIRSGATVPANCTPTAGNSLFYKNSGSNIGLYECTAANTWTFRGSINFGGTLTPSALDEDKNNYNPTGLSSSFTVRLDTDGGDHTITGLATGSNGRLVLLVNISSNTITLSDQDSASTAANRFLFGSNLALAANGSILLRYDGTSSRWRVISTPITDPLPAVSGENLTNLNASNLSSGTVPNAQFPATLPAVSGANLTNLNASNLSSGTVPNAQFPATLPAVSGANLTNLNASNLSSGTVPNAQFPATLPAVSGANLTNLNASNLSSGTMPVARFQAAAPTWSAAHIFNVDGANSTPPVQIAGGWFSGGTVSTTYPQLLISDQLGVHSTPPSVWNTNGTGLGIVSSNGFAGDMLNLVKNNVSVYKVDSNGALTAGASKFNINSSGLPTQSNNLTLAGQGFPLLLGITSQKSETASADTNVLTVTPAAAAGTYRVCTSISVSSATSGVISWTASWTDSNGNAQSNIAMPLFQFGTAAPNTTFTTSAAGNYYGCSLLDVNSAGANIVVKWVGGGTTAAKMSATVERLN